MNTRRLNVPVYILVFVLTACSGSSPANDVSFENQTWYLTAYKASAPIAGTELTIQFEGGQVSGRAGCNHYGGGYQINNDEIRFNDLFNTEMACMEPAGVMDQEQIYLALLASANRITLEDDVLTLFVDSDPILIFKLEPEVPAVSAATPEPLIPTSTAPEPTPTIQLTAEPPTGLQEFRDSAAGISLFIPESWSVSTRIEGQSAIFQSYPVDKYVGGEGFEPGDTKCDLTIRPPGSTAAEVIQQWETGELTTIVSEEEMALQSGQIGHRVVVESMGRSISLVTEINNRAVVFACFGDPEPFESLAASLSGFEPTVYSTLYDAPEGFKTYQDVEAGISLAMPGSWMVTGIVPGNRATLQSYPENKYVGGEALVPGDTKCDLFIRRDVGADDFRDQIMANEAVTVLSEGEIILHSGHSAFRIEMESLGPSLLTITEIDNATVLLTCYGDFSEADSIAATLKAND